MIAAAHLLKSSPRMPMHARGRRKHIRRNTAWGPTIRPMAPTTGCTTPACKLAVISVRNLESSTALYRRNAVYQAIGDLLAGRLQARISMASPIVAPLGTQAEGPTAEALCAPRCAERLKRRVSPFHSLRAENRALPLTTPRRRPRPPISNAISIDPDGEKPALRVRHRRHTAHIQAALRLATRRNERSGSIARASLKPREALARVRRSGRD